MVIIASTVTIGMLFNGIWALLTQPYGSRIAPTNNHDQPLNG